MNKTIDRTLTRQQWEELRYPINLQALTEEEGGGWFATIPLLGEATCAADGETLDEAISNLEEYRRSLYDLVIASNHPIPLPRAVTEREPKPAGKWLMRTSPDLHARLQNEAEKEGISFNAFCVECLSRGLEAQAAKNAVVQELATLKEELLRDLGDQMRRQVRSEIRIATQSMMDEFSYERARTTFFEAAVQVEPVIQSSSYAPRRSMREKVDRELTKKELAVDIAA